jgi:hypothetical protein
MIVDFDAARVVETPNGDLYSIGDDLFVHAQRAATHHAEAPFGKG